MVLVNEEMDFGKVIVIDNLGIKHEDLSFKEALDFADEVELDLVMVGEGEVPVLKIMDYSRHLYEVKKKKRENKKEVKAKLKEIKMNLNIGDNDLKIKVKNALRILNKGDKVRVVVMFKGRELSYPELGKNLLLKFIDFCDGQVVVTREIKHEGRNTDMIIELMK